MSDDTILQYRLIEKIGAGGMGVVWRALDTRLNREVALKFLSEAATTDPSRRERLFREARAASALNHPNIVTIFDISSADGRAFIAMELVPGRPLSEVLRGHTRISPGTTVDWAIQLCDGLGAAHRRGIVHRDIKPSNIMLSDQGNVKILDFGLAKFAPREPGAAAHDAISEPFTLTGDIVGTVPYMSPEQVSGDRVGPRSDVFSVGVVLYEMLSGRRPFAGASNAEIARALLTSEPPPLRALTPTVPESLTSIVHKCLKRKPEDRYADAGEIASRLRALDRRAWPRAASELTTVLMDAPAPPPERRRKGWAITASFVVLALLAVAVYAWRFVSPSRATLTTAQAYLERYDRRGNVDRAIALLEPAVQKDGMNSALDAVLAEAYVRKYEEAPTKARLEAAVSLARKSVAADQHSAAGHVVLGMALAAIGDKSAAQDQFQQARNLDPNSGRAYLGLAKLTPSPDAEQLYHAAIQHSPGDWIPVSELGAYYYRHALYDESIAAWRQALAMARDNVKVMAYLAAGYHMKGQYGDVADISLRALSLDGTDATAWANLGTARYFQGHFADAVEATENAVKYEASRYLYWGNLGDDYRWSEGNARASDAYAEAIRLVRERLAVNAGDDALRGSLAVYLAKTGDCKAAVAEISRSSAVDAGALFKAATVYEVCQDREKALNALGRAIRAGYSLHEISHEPELAALRSDPRYPRIANLQAPPKK